MKRARPAVLCQAFRCGIACAEAAPESRQGQCSKAVNPRLFRPLLALSYGCASIHQDAGPADQWTASTHEAFRSRSPPSSPPSPPYRTAGVRRVPDLVRRLAFAAPPLTPARPNAESPFTPFAGARSPVLVRDSSPRDAWRVCLVRKEVASTSQPTRHSIWRLCLFKPWSRSYQCNEVLAAPDRASFFGACLSFIRYSEAGHGIRRNP